MKSWIRATLTKKVLYTVSGLFTAKQIWKTLEEVSAHDTKDREHSFITKLHTCRNENLSIPEYLKHFKGICDELAVIQNQFRMMTR